REAKVQLKEQKGPLDWVNVTNSGENLSGVPSVLRVTPKQLKHNNGTEGRPAWSSFQGKVYNITPYFPFHPGGELELGRAAGKDCEKLFMGMHPWVNLEKMLGKCFVGTM
ncbi:cytochrome b5, partial [Mytilinidion resinicola]